MNLALTAGVSEVTPRRHRTSPLLLMAQSGTCSTVFLGPHGRIVTSLRGIGGTSCQGPVVVSLHFLRVKNKVIIIKCMDEQSSGEQNIHFEAYLAQRLRRTKSFNVLFPWYDLEQ